MDRQVTDESEARFVGYVAALTSVIGQADRARPLHDYCVGLVATEGRKSVEPMAAVTAPAEVSVQHQRMLHFVSNSPWPDEPVLAKVREVVVPQIERHGPIEAWIIDDTSLPKQGKHSVGVEHQYCGELGKQAICQVAVTLFDRQSSCQPADRLSTLSAADLGERQEATQQGACSQEDQVQDQAADRT
jgi:SRSO17 transposase